MQQITKSAGQHVARCAACEQPAKATGQDIAESAAERTALIAGRLWRWNGSRCRIRLLATWCEVLHRLPRQQSEDCHRHRRHAAVVLRGRMTGSVRTVLHAVEDIE